MVIGRGNATWGSSFSTAEIHLTDEMHAEESRAGGETKDSFSIRQCPIISSLNPQTQVKWKNTFQLRQMTLSNIATAAGPVRQTLSAQATTKLRGRCMTSAGKSLDLLRLNLQSIINKEIDAVLKKYLNRFFKPAIENIRNNLGENSVTEENVRLVCRQMLEDAKIQYYGGAQSRGSSPYSDSETGSVGDCSRYGHNASRSPLPLLHNKRKESDTDSEASQSVARPRKKAMRTVTNVVSGLPVPAKTMKWEGIRRAGPKWDPERIVKSTLFIMGARANKVLGFGQTRGRLYTKHPELLKYSGDAEDKEWLSRHNLMPPTGGIAYLLVLEDVKELAESEEYRHNPNVLFGDLKGFEAPDFMLKKIRAFVAQARTDGKDAAGATPLADAGDASPFALGEEKSREPPAELAFLQVNARFHYPVDCASVVMTPPATVFGSAPRTHCESLELADCPAGLLSSAQGHEFLSAAANGLPGYDSVAYCEGSKPGLPLLYPPEPPAHSALGSFLASSLETGNPHGVAI